MGKKFFYKIIIFLVLCFLPSVKASSNLYVTGDTVYMRSGAGTNFTVLDTFDKGQRLVLNSDKLISGPGCSDGWYSVTYNNKKGYICSSFASLSEPVTTDYRPWTSPKKAIYGGAKFIAEGYIAEGQNTSYLKKFNVNPNSGYNVFTHQYMANLAAPTSEALTSYRTYQENGLLSLALNFEIPIFKNMPGQTSHPYYGAVSGGTSKVTDNAFEKKLDEQQFPESYKKWLRALHNEHPNWTFKALHTNLDFNNAVETEKWISSISACSSCYLADPNPHQTEPGWYIANSQTVSYYLDPRNFLDLDSILMFEDLSYSSNHNASVVSGVLKGTFMNGNDPIDNMSYAQIFVDAGKTHDVSPVYLASLARQEMGVSAGLAATGERFTYKGNTYEGFYNFFNIGAYSSEEKPCKAGLVYAASGSSKDSSGVFKGNIPAGSLTPSTPAKPAEVKPNNNHSTTPSTTPAKPSQGTSTAASFVSKANLNQKGNYVTNIDPGTKVSDLKNRFGNSSIVIKSSNGVALSGNDLMSTGSKISFPNGEVVDVVLYGDLTGDGQINSADLLRMRQILLNKVTLSGAYDEASHVYTTSGKINSADLLRLRQHLLGKNQINQA